MIKSTDYLPILANYTLQQFKGLFSNQLGLSWFHKFDPDNLFFDAFWNIALVLFLVWKVSDYFATHYCFYSLYPFIPHVQEKLFHQVMMHQAPYFQAS